jgi:hypothetical protein
MSEIWDLWIGSVGATGLSFGRAKVDATAAADRVLVHAAPRLLSVSVRSSDDGRLVAEGHELARTDSGPMCTLIRDGTTLRLEEGWPTEDDIGRLVLLPGGEAGILTAWWHADDLSAWRWSVEFSNHR